MKVGILGGGQLGRMMALAGYPLGLRFCVLDNASDVAAAQLADVIVGEFSDEAALAKLAESVDIATYEFENVPVESARLVAERVPLFPPPAGLEMAQDRLTQKRFFESVGIPIPAIAEVNDLESLRAGVAELGLPAILKTRRGGYDGKGQFTIRDPEAIDVAWDAVGGLPSILEEFIPFQREVSIIAARSRVGEMAFYPLVENLHIDGILRRSLAPAPGLTPELQEQAERYARRVFTALDYVGVLTIELFQLDGQLVANELATRVHNSGHWTIEGAETSQFENHLRAILGLPLGSPAAIGYSSMINLIAAIPPLEQMLRLPEAHVHLYGKEPQPRRKVGHITLRADTPDQRDAFTNELCRIIGEPSLQGLHA